MRFSRIVFTEPAALRRANPPETNPMQRTIPIMLAALAAWMLCATALYAQDELQQLREEVRALTEQVNLMSAGAGQPGERRATVGGYAELHYNKPIGDEAIMDFHRFVLFVGYSYNDWISFYSELEVEHAIVEGGEESGEVSMEQTYLDFAISPTFHARGGIMLVPMSIINPVHEPPTFYGVERPDFHRFIIPSTWSEGGAGVTGRLPGNLNYEAYALAPLDASGFQGRDAVRGGRRKGFESPADNLALTGRLDYQVPGLLAGASFYSADTANETVEQDAQEKGVSLDSVPVTIYGAHLAYQVAAFQLRAEYAAGTIGNTDKLNQVYEKNDASSAFNGLYLEPSLRVWQKDEQSLGVFARYEDINPQAEVESGSVDDSLNFTKTFLGFNYWPHPDVAVKADYFIKSPDEGDESSGYNLGLGWRY
jgi:hypothetical protein